MDKRLLITYVVGVCLTIVLVWYSTSGKEEVRQVSLSEIKTNETVSKHSDNPEDLNYSIVVSTKKLSEEFLYYLESFESKYSKGKLAKIIPNKNDDLYMELDTSLRRPTEAIDKKVVTEVLAYPIDDILPNR